MGIWQNVHILATSPLAFTSTVHIWTTNSYIIAFFSVNSTISIFAKTLYIVISITKAISTTIFLISSSQLIHIATSISLFTEAIFISSSHSFIFTIFTKANTIDRSQRESGGRLRANLTTILK